MKDYKHILSVMLREKMDQNLIGVDDEEWATQRAMESDRLASEKYRQDINHSSKGFGLDNLDDGRNKTGSQAWYRAPRRNYDKKTGSTPAPARTPPVNTTAPAGGSVAAPPSGNIPVTPEDNFDLGYHNTMAGYRLNPDGSIQASVHPLTTNVDTPEKMAAYRKAHNLVADYPDGPFEPSELSPSPPVAAPGFTPPSATPGSAWMYHRLTYPVKEMEFTAPGYTPNEYQLSFPSPGQYGHYIEEPIPTRTPPVNTTAPAAAPALAQTTPDKKKPSWKLPPSTQPAAPAPPAGGSVADGLIAQRAAARAGGSVAAPATAPAAAPAAAPAPTSTDVKKAERAERARLAAEERAERARLAAEHATAMAAERRKAELDSLKALHAWRLKKQTG